MDTNGKVLSLAAVGLVTCVNGCAPQPRLENEPNIVADMRPEAVMVATGRGASDLKCQTTSAAVVDEMPIVEPQDEGWFESPSRARYTVAISGCGRQATYSVSCSERGQQCISSEEYEAVTADHRTR
jgi:hypothetical protein